MNGLQLCAGATRRPGWKTLDAGEADYVATLPPLPTEVREIQWDEIEWVHGISSFYPWEGSEILEEIRGVLAPGGRLTLEQPDIRKCSGVAGIFGDPLPRDPLHMNRWGYTPDSLTELLKEAGFTKITVFPAQHHLAWRDFRIEAYA